MILFQLVTCLSTLCHGSVRARLELCFDSFNEDRSGFLSFDQLEVLVDALVNTSKGLSQQPPGANTAAAAALAAMDHSSFKVNEKSSDAAGSSEKSSKEEEREGGEEEEDEAPAKEEEKDGKTEMGGRAVSGSTVTFAEGEEEDDESNNAEKQLAATNEDGSSSSTSVRAASPGIVFTSSDGSCDEFSAPVKQPLLARLSPRHTQSPGSPRGRVRFVHNRCVCFQSLCMGLSPRKISVRSRSRFPLISFFPFLLFSVLFVSFRRNSPGEKPTRNCERLTGGDALSATL